MMGILRSSPTYARSIVRDALKVVSVGFGLGVWWLLAAGCAPDLAEPLAEEQRTENSSTVSAATWTDVPWPFTVDRGELRCIGPVDDPGVFLVTDQGEMYALNPAAIRMADRVGAIADLDPIWRDHPDVLDAKVNVSPMILYGLALCREFGMSRTPVQTEVARIQKNANDSGRNPLTGQRHDG